jgi:valyl-tRNA synthetase
MGVLRLLHPFMPFVTEDIWQRMPGVEASIMKASFPGSSDFISDKLALDEMELVMGVITGVRNIRGEMNIHPSKKIDILMEIPDQKDIDIIKNNISHIRNLIKAGSMEIEKHAVKPEASATTVLGHNQIHVLLKGIIDFEEEKKRIRKEIAKIRKDMEGDARKLSSSAFLENAPPDIVEKVQEKVQTMKIKLDKLDKNLKFFEAIND